MEMRAPTIEQLLEVDHHNSLESIQRMRELDPLLIEMLDTIAISWSVLGDLFSDKAHLTESFDRIGDLQEKLKLNTIEGLKLIADAELLEFGSQLQSSDEITTIKTELAKIRTALPRNWLLLRLNRDYLFGVTDLLRGRLSTAFSYVRLQLESAAVLYLSTTNNKIANDFWLSIGQGGKKFHNKYSRDISKFIKHDLGLEDEFDLSSNLGHHSRLGGVIKGLKMGQRTERNSVFKTTGLIYQEYEDGADMLLFLTRYVRSQIRLISRFDTFIPELKEDQKAMALAYKVSSLESRFSDKVRDLLSKHEKAKAKFGGKSTNT